MQVLYHLTMPPSPMAACDAVVQDIEALRAVGSIRGQVIHLYPGRKPGTHFPRRWWGLQHLPYLLHAEPHVDLHHFFNPDPFPFDVLRFLRRPIVYTTVAGVRGSDYDTVQHLARLTRTLVVPTESGRIELQTLGIANVITIRPGIDTARFSHTPPPTQPFTLLMGSAPWTIEQFESKGVEALLEAAQARRDLRLIFLWRGLHVGEMERRVAQRGLGERVTVINRQVDVNEVLAQVHAAIVLADDTRLVKAYPHSLLEALAAGKPVLVSRAIPMSDYVEQTSCGKVVERINPPSLLAALDQLEADYEACRATAIRAGRHDFSQQQMMQAYRQLYMSLSPT
jgi:glycosyltransferase involved in cell wall biosynthesis